MPGDGVDQGHEQQRKGDVGAKADPLGHRPGHDRGRGHGKARLEEELGLQRDGGPVQGAEDAAVGVSRGGRVVSAGEQ